MSGFADYLAVTAPASLDAVFTRGDSWQLALTLRDGAGRRVSLAGMTGVFELSRWGAQPYLPYGVVTLDPALLPPTAGDVLVSLDGLTTAALPADRFAWALRLTSGASTKTVLRGWLAEAATQRQASCGGYGADGQLLTAAGACEAAPACACAPSCEARITVQVCGLHVVIS